MRALVTYTYINSLTKPTRGKYVHFFQSPFDTFQKTIWPLFNFYL